MGLGKGIGVGGRRRIDEDGAVDGGAVPLAVSVPPKSAFFDGEDDLLPKPTTRLDWALSDVFRTI